MIHIKQLSLSFGSQAVFDDISLNITDNARIGLVGRNGSGKSTLLKVIAQQQPIDGGSISILPNKRVAYMPQEVALQSSRTILDETMHAVADISSLKKQLAYFEQQIEQGHTDEETIDAYVHLQEQITNLEPEQLQAQAERILHGLGFTSRQLSQPVSSLSVGWKMRIVLAQLLLQKADFYLFDEPTNHLDIVAKDWFLNFLQEADFGFLLVSHERYFLDKLCTTIIALEQGKAKLYKGNYSAFETQYAEDLKQLEAAYIQQQKDIKQRQATIARFKAKSSKAKMAKSMQKKLDNTELITLPSSAREVHFQFAAPKRSGRIVLSTHNVSHAFDTKQLFKQIDLKIERGERVALVAANGVGKTTLFNLMVGNVPLQQGSIEFGHNVEHAIFAQDQNESLDFDKTIFENAQEACSQKSEQQIRSFLGAFLFNGDEVKKKVGVLSGGEKNRVAMAIVLMQDSNLLLLDEPTNHLDMISKEILIRALKEFQGTILFVSHDHNFINELATRVIELTPHGALSYHGNYEAYLHQRGEALTAYEPKIKRREKKETDKTQDSDLSKKSRTVERSIEKLEKEITRIEHSFADLEYGTPAFAQAEQKLLTKQQQLEQLMTEWEALHE